ncbi:hypothetical protein QEH40_gp37 [Microbacterium phage OscarSo]|uniref:Uncharacterized protein n=1 Tax=Microbacterium phage OscarSo TaxID=2985324 RepID=A0A9X9K4E4_9CAUD|nr:hypothetical protein QEH40_gp37 [Microbacterium phage OscarSo]UYL87158.1 hypothetical protein SEA_OSCARSO_37 [Microbacterium phage OscarSo]
MSRQSNARALRRKAARTGIALAERIIIEHDAIVAAESDPGVKVRELIAYHVDIALEALESRGADLTGHVVVTMGDHPDYPGAFTIEAKAASLKPSHAPVDDCPGCPLDHSLDASGDD